MKWARIENDTAIEVTDIDPAGRYAPSLIWHEVPDDVVANSKLVDGEWVHPPAVEIVPAEPEPSPLPLLSPVEFKLLFTAEERIAIRSAKDSDPVVFDMWDILDDPRLTQVDRNLQSTKDSILYLVSAGFLTAERGDEIISA